VKKYFLYLIFTFFFNCCTKKQGITPGIKNNPISQAVICDTVNVSYSCLIKPILVNNCYVCHSTAASDTGNFALDLETFQSFKTYLKLFYKNDSIYGSKFYNTILQSPTTNRMPPPPDNKLSTYDLRMIKKWIDAGANQN